jgi:hypothetical protein
MCAAFGFKDRSDPQLWVAQVGLKQHSSSVHFAGSAHLMPSGFGLGARFAGHERAKLAHVGFMQHSEVSQVVVLHWYDSGEGLTTIGDAHLKLSQVGTWQHSSVVQPVPAQTMLVGFTLAGRTPGHWNSGLAHVGLSQQNSLVQVLLEQRWRAALTFELYGVVHWKLAQFA